MSRWRRWQLTSWGIAVHASCQHFSCAPDKPCVTCQFLVHVSCLPAKSNILPKASWGVHNIHTDGLLIVRWASNSSWKRQVLKMHKLHILQQFYYDPLILKTTFKTLWITSKGTRQRLPSYWLYTSSFWARNILTRKRRFSIVPPCIFLMLLCTWQREYGVKQKRKLRVESWVTVQ